MGEAYPCMHSRARQGHFPRPPPFGYKAGRGFARNRSLSSVPAHAQFRPNADLALYPKGVPAIRNQSTPGR